jgi:hypothetical protein
MACQAETWRRLVGSAGPPFAIANSRIQGNYLVGTGSSNAPVVASGMFEDTGFTGRQPDHFPKVVAGVGVAPTEAEVMSLA